MPFSDCSLSFARIMFILFSYCALYSEHELNS